MASFSTQAGQVGQNLKHEANHCLRCLQPFKPVERSVPQVIWTALQDGAASAGRGFFQKRDVDAFPHIWCFYALKGLSITTAKQLLRVMAQSLAACKCLLVNMLLNTTGWMAAEPFVVELLERSLPSQDRSLPAWAVMCMLVHTTNQGLPDAHSSSLWGALQKVWSSAAKSAPRPAAGVVYIWAPVHKLVLHAWLDGAGVQRLQQWVQSVATRQAGKHRLAAATELAAAHWDCSELHLLANTRGELATHAQALLNVISILPPPSPSSAALPWIHLLEWPTASSLLDLLVQQPGPHLPASANHALQPASSAQQLALVAVFLVSAICRPQGLVELCSSCPSLGTTAEWVVFNAHHLLLTTLQCLADVSSRVPRLPQAASMHAETLHTWALLIATVSNQAPALDSAFRSLNLQNRRLLETYAQGLSVFSHGASSAPQVQLWPLLVSTCICCFLDGHSNPGTAMGNGAVRDLCLGLIWPMLRACMERHGTFHVLYHVATCVLAEQHVATTLHQSEPADQETSQLMLRLLNKDIRYLPTVMACSLANASALKNFIMDVAQALPTERSYLHHFLAGCLRLLRRNPQDVGSYSAWSQGFSRLATTAQSAMHPMQACLQLSQALPSAAFCYLYGDDQGRAALGYMLSWAVGRLQQQADEKLTGCVQSVVDMVLSDPQLRKDPTISDVAGVAFTLLAAQDLGMEEDGEVDGVPPVTEPEQELIADGQAAWLWAATAKGAQVPLDFSTTHALPLATTLGWEPLLQVARRQGSVDPSGALPWLPWWVRGAMEAVGPSHNVAVTGPLEAFTAAVMAPWWEAAWGAVIREEVEVLKQELKGAMAATAGQQQLLDTFLHLNSTVMAHGKDPLQWPVLTLSHLCSQLPKLAIQCCLACVQQPAVVQPPESEMQDMVPETPPEGDAAAAAVAAGTLASHCAEEDVHPTCLIIRCCEAVAAACQAQLEAVAQHLQDVLEEAMMVWPEEIGHQSASGLEGQARASTVPACETLRISDATASAELHRNKMQGTLAVTVAAAATAVCNVPSEVQQVFRDVLAAKASIRTCPPADSYPSFAPEATAHLHAIHHAVLLATCLTEDSLQGLKGVLRSGAALNCLLTVPLQMALVACLCCSTGATHEAAGLRDNEDVGSAGSGERPRPPVSIPEVVLALEPLLPSLLLCSNCQQAGARPECEALLQGQHDTLSQQAALPLTDWLQAQLGCPAAAPISGRALQALLTRMCAAASRHLLSHLASLLLDTSPLTPEQRAAAGRLKQQLQQQDIWLLLQMAATQPAPLLKLRDDEHVAVSEDVFAALDQPAYAAAALKLLQSNLQNVQLLCNFSKSACRLTYRCILTREQVVAYVAITEALFVHGANPDCHCQLQLMRRDLVTTWLTVLSKFETAAFQGHSRTTQHQLLSILSTVHQRVGMVVCIASGPAAVAFAEPQVSDALLATLMWLQGMMSSNSWQGMEAAEELMLSIAEETTTVFGTLALQSRDMASRFVSRVIPVLPLLQGHVILEVGCSELQALASKWGSGILESLHVASGEERGDAVRTTDDGFLLLLHKCPTAAMLLIVPSRH